MKLNKKEIQAVLTISTIVSLRLMGIFLILPVFSIYSLDYPGATLALAGIAFGIYALAQSLLQIPFGWASDKFGRKNILLLGLAVFSVGSLICGFAEDINQLIFARILQGCGAVGSVAIASLGDLTRPHVRAQSFSITGIVIGITFILSLVAGPFLAARYGFESLFFILAFLGLLSIIFTLVLFPDIEKKISDQESASYLGLCIDGEIKKLFFSAFTISFILNLFLFIYPISLSNANVDTSSLWKIYLIILMPSALFVYPYIRFSEKNNSLNITTTLGFLMLLLSMIIYLFTQDYKLPLLISGMVFFIGHTIYQSILPAFLTIRIPSANRGITSGFYNLSSFFGAALGGMLSGIMYDIDARLPMMISLGVITLWIFFGLPKPPDNRVEESSL